MFSPKYTNMTWEMREMQVFSNTPDPTESKTLGIGLSNLYFNQPSRWGPLKFENYCYLAWYLVNIFLVEVYFKRPCKELFLWHRNLSNFQYQTTEHIIAFTLSYIYEGTGQDFVLFLFVLFSFISKCSQCHCIVWTSDCCHWKSQSYLHSSLLCFNFLMYLPHLLTGIHQYPAQSLAHRRSLIIIN